MKKFVVFFVLLAFLGMLAVNVPQGHAQGIQTPTPVQPGSTAPDVISFSVLDEKDIVLRGPFDSAAVQFAPPASWALQDGASVSLEINASFSQPGITDGQSPTIEQGTMAGLQVWLNNELLETIFIEENGLQTFRISIPLAALKSARADGRQSLDFILDASLDCRFLRETTIVIQSNSSIFLPHTATSPQTDLALLPKPFFQRYSFLPEPALLVVPASPTAEELKAAMAVAAGFGRMSSGDLVLQLVPLNLLTDEQKSSSHLIFVGKASSMQPLGVIQFPVAISSQGLSAAGSQPDDGFVQMGVSPWNPARAVLFAGGNTDVGVVKAAQAVSSGMLQPGSRPNLAVISQVNASVKVPPVLEDRTLASLGYANRTISGYGFSSLDYNFYIPPGQAAGEGAYFNLMYTHTALLDTDSSSLLVVINDQKIGSQRFSEETSKQLNTLKVNIPANILRSGDNRLSVRAELEPLNFCSQNIDNTLWMTVNNASLIHLPLVTSESDVPSQLLSLNQYYIPFLNSPTLDMVGFVVAKSDPTSWDIAAALAADLGRRSSGQVLGPEVVFTDAVPDSFIQNHDLIVIGRASQLPIIAGMADAMPAPFEANSDQASERNMTVTYRLEPNASVGYFQLFTSPYGSKYSVLAILGSTEEGLSWSGNVLKTSSLRSRLAGNFAVINREQILTTDTRVGIVSNLSATAVPGALPTVVSLSPNGTPVVQGRPAWILPSILITSVLIIVLVIIVTILGRSRNSQIKRQ
ncbi:MAG: cellulose biosynthesis cyclic di-GMP-binding regulatory protein BcsB [Chloroflexi bacterium]|nr:cellulose biosynthesis cyclic di-GMP-binding regulatory protein BcsB [Chloroflexota bacterium]